MPLRLIVGLIGDFLLVKIIMADLVGDISSLSSEDKWRVDLKRFQDLWR